MSWRAGFVGLAVLMMVVGLAFAEAHYTADGVRLFRIPSGQQLDPDKWEYCVQTAHGCRWMRLAMPTMLNLEIDAAPMDWSMMRRSVRGSALLLIALVLLIRFRAIFVLW